MEKSIRPRRDVQGPTPNACAWCDVDSLPRPGLAPRSCDGALVRSKRQFRKPNGRRLGLRFKMSPAPGISVREFQTLLCDTARIGRLPVQYFPGRRECPAELVPADMAQTLWRSMSGPISSRVWRQQSIRLPGANDSSAFITSRVDK